MGISQAVHVQVDAWRRSRVCYSSAQMSFKFVKMSLLLSAPLSSSHHARQCGLGVGPSLAAEDAVKAHALPCRSKYFGTAILCFGDGANQHGQSREDSHRGP